MKGDHCVCCQHYQAHWRVRPSAWFEGWFEAIPPTDDNREGAYFPTEQQAVEYARKMRDNPGVWFGVDTGRSLMDMLWLDRHGLLNTVRGKCE